ncbi:MAG: PaaI family thioesterase [Pseudomonadota bacterium]
MSLTPPYHQALTERFLQVVPHVRELGMSIVDLQTEGIHIRLPYREEWLGDVVHGLIHPGIISTLVDSGSGLAVLARLENPEPIATLDLRMDYQRPALKDLALDCRAEAYRVTPHIVFVRATVWQTDESKPVALSQLAFMRSSTSKKRVV